MCSDSENCTLGVDGLESEDSERARVSMVELGRREGRKLREESVFNVV